MATGRFFTDMKSRFSRGDIATQLLYINIGVFLLVTVVNIVLILFRLPTTPYTGYLELPSSLTRFLRQPWSIITYMFMHAGLLHLIFNMLWLYWFGKLFLMFFSGKHLRGIYILGGICGGLLYMLAYNLFPYFEDMVDYSTLVGASASVLAIVFAVGMAQPNYEVQFMFIGRIKLKYVTLCVFLLDLLFITSGNSGGHIAHIGGALSGIWFASSLRKGRDITGWINKIIDTLTGGVKIKRRKPKMKVHYNNDKQKDYEYNAKKKQQSDEIDRILDKLRKSGYGSLTDDEKKSLFNASKK